MPIAERAWEELDTSPELEQGGAGAVGGTPSDVTSRGPGFRGLAFASLGCGQKGFCNPFLSVLTLKTKLQFVVFMFVPSKKASCYVYAR